MHRPRLRRVLPHRPGRTERHVRLPRAADELRPVLHAALRGLLPRRDDGLQRRAELPLRRFLVALRLADARADVAAVRRADARPGGADGRPDVERADDRRLLLAHLRGSLPRLLAGERRRGRRRNPALRRRDDARRRRRGPRRRRGRRRGRRRRLRCHAGQVRLRRRPRRRAGRPRARLRGRRRGHRRAPALLRVRRRHRRRGRPPRGALCRRRRVRRVRFGQEQLALRRGARRGVRRRARRVDRLRGDGGGLFLRRSHEPHAPEHGLLRGVPRVPRRRPRARLPRGPHGARRHVRAPREAERDAAVLRGRLRRLRGRGRVGDALRRGLVALHLRVRGLGDVQRRRRDAPARGRGARLQQFGRRGARLLGPRRPPLRRRRRADGRQPRGPRRERRRRRLQDGGQLRFVPGPLEPVRPDQRPRQQHRAPSLLVRRRGDGSGRRARALLRDDLRHRPAAEAEPAPGDALHRRRPVRGLRPRRRPDARRVVVAAALRRVGRVVVDVLPLDGRGLHLRQPERRGVLRPNQFSRESQVRTFCHRRVS